MTLKYFNKDFSAGLSVFLVTLPLCLGIALASGAPLFSGLLAGIVGGIVVTLFSGSEVSVSGPAAGLTIIVLDSIEVLGSFSHFLTAVVLAGAFQYVLGWLKAGRLSSFVPSSVINGMLVAIGIVIILKQIPHALGWDADVEGEFDFLQLNHHNTFSEILEALSHPHPGAIAISITCLAVMITWEYFSKKDFRFFKVFPIGLLVVLTGVLMNQVFKLWIPGFYLEESTHLVKVPLILSLEDASSAFHFPVWEALANPKVYLAAFTLMLVASIESLLSLEVADKLDPQRRVSSPSQELKAQGIGNMVSGLIGGLPLTLVTLRTSVNIYSGSKTRLSAFIQGVLMLIAVITIPQLLNFIPLACLASLLLLIGYKLVTSQKLPEINRKSLPQFLPFSVTIAGIIFSDLLLGIVLGLLAGIISIIVTNNRSAISMARDQQNILVLFIKDVTFMNKPYLKSLLDSFEKGDSVYIDGTRAEFIDHDIFQLLDSFKKDAPYRGIQVEFKGISPHKHSPNNAIISKTPFS